MKKRKLAQANIIVAVLLIVIVIVAIFIVFNIVNPLINEKSGGIKTGFDAYIKSLFQKPQIENALTTNSITQYGITWTFDKNYTYGQFANGDYWILGPVKIISINPPSINSSGRIMNGAMVNPSPLSNGQGFDNAMASNTYTASLNAAFNVGSSNPLTLNSGSSLVSTISNSTVGNWPQLTDAAILTVLSVAPPSGSFRPAYVGTNKTIKYNISQLNYSPLGTLPSVNGTPTLASVERNIQRPWIDFIPNWNGEYAFPSNNMPNYGDHIAMQIGDAALMLNLNFTNAQKQNLMIYLTQIGIDYYGVVQLSGNVWAADGGHSSGRKWPIMFAGLVLNDSSMKDIGQKSGSYLYNGSYGPGNNPLDYVHFGEDDQAFYVPANKIGTIVSEPYRSDHIYGDDSDTTTVEQYIASQAGMPEWAIRHDESFGSDREDWDTANYRTSNTANSWAGFILSALIMGQKTKWNNNALFDYQDRYMANEKTLGHVGDGWQRQWSRFAESMWDTYKAGYGCIWTSANSSDIYSNGYYNCFGSANFTCVARGGLCTHGNCVSVSTCADYGGNQRAIAYDPCNLGCSVTTTQTADHITRNNITWYFDKNYTYGQFANGDYWVLGPVTVVRVNPMPTTYYGYDYRNNNGTYAIDGSELNPSFNGTSIGLQGYDSRANDYRANLGVNYPATIPGGNSLMSTRSITQEDIPKDCSTGYHDVTGACVSYNDTGMYHSFLYQAAVLTIVSSIPPDNGTTVFRPPYAGKNKPYFSINNLHRELLPKLSSSNKPDITSYYPMFTNVWLEHKDGSSGRTIHPVKNMPNYGREEGNAIGNAAAVISLDYTDVEKEPLLIGMVQVGIDNYYTMLTGSYWSADGGTNNGRKWPIIFAGILLNNDSMKNVGPGLGFGEDGGTYYGTNGVALFGSTCTDSSSAFSASENCILSSSCKTAKDPFGTNYDACGYVDCCTSATWVGQTLTARLIKDVNGKTGEQLWNHTALFDYVDRWMDHPDEVKITAGGIGDSRNQPVVTALWSKYRYCNSSADCIGNPMGSICTPVPCPLRDDPGEAYADTCAAWNKKECSGAVTPPATCSDGTLNKTCSSNKPLYCNSNLVLVNNCSACGCSTGTCNSGTQQCEQTQNLINSCQEISNSGTYYLNRSLSGAEVTDMCIKISGNNIVFDCQGKSIINSALEGTAIFVSGNSNTVKNCSVQAAPTYFSSLNNGKGHGFLITGNNNLIEKNTVSNTFWGIDIAGDYNTIQNNLVQGGSKGIHVTYHKNNIIKNNILLNNNQNQGWGLGVWGFEGNQLINNSVLGSRYGLVIYRGNDTRIMCGSINGNSVLDIYLYGAPWYYTDGRETNLNISLIGTKYTSKYIGDGAQFIESNTEVCTGGIDEDCDGLIDCNDSDCSAAPNCQIPLDYLAYWKLDGNLNDEKATHNGICSGTSCPSLSSDRKASANSSYNFDGINDYFNVSIYSDLMTGNISVLFWINPNAGTSSSWQRVIASPSGTNSFAITFTPSTNTLTISRNQNKTITKYVTVIPDTWQHVVAGYDNSNIPFIYVNGTSRTLQSASDYTGLDTGSLRIGARQSGAAGYYFNGSLDEIMIYNRTLNASEVSQIYNYQK